MKNILRSGTAWATTLILLPFFASTTFAQINSTVGAPDSLVRIMTILPGTTQPQPVTVSVRNGIARMEGDIVLGPIADLQNAQDRGVVLDKPTASLYRWDNAEIPYTVAPGFSPQYEALIRTAIDYINGTTHLLIVHRQSQIHYIDFTPSDVCESGIGRSLLLGAQVVSLQEGGCGFAEIIHEIAHAAGLWHEQSREDRDNFVTIQWNNIDEDDKHNFEKHVFDGTDIGAYDFDSDMHYGAFDFAINTALPTIIANSGHAFGNATEYSVGDIASINWMYPSNNCPSNLTLSETIPSVHQPMVFEVSNTLISTAKVVGSNNITYDGAIRIILSPGFQALAGSTFHAVNEGCGGIFQRGSNPEVEEWMAAAENTKTEQQQAIGQAGGFSLPDLNISPNPFSGSTAITYTLPVAQKVDIQILSVVGNVVAQPVRQEYQEAGRYEYNFRAENLPAGVYLLLMQTGGQRQTKRLVLSR